MSYGQSLLRGYLQTLVADTMIENYRPIWLNGLELDFYFDKLRIAFEFQGDQHFVDTERFGKCYGRRCRDREKLELCNAYGIVLVRVVAWDLDIRRLQKQTWKSIRWAVRHRVISYGRSKRLRSSLFRAKTRKQAYGYVGSRQLNRSSKEYRQVIIKNFESFTALPNNGERKKAKKALILKNNACAPTPFVP